MNEHNPASVMAQMIIAAENHTDEMQKDRLKATEYYNGELKDVPSDEGRSSVTSRDVRDEIKKVLPSVMRTLLGSDVVGEYQPAREGDEGFAKQATDYINRVVAPEVDLRRHVESAAHDALLLRNGILRWSWDEKREALVSSHTGLEEEAFSILVGAPEVELLGHSERVEIVSTPEGEFP